MKYPELKFVTSSTPETYLACCDICKRAQWSIFVEDISIYCCSTRTREATLQEYIEAEKQLIRIRECA